MALLTAAPAFAAQPAATSHAQSADQGVSAPPTPQQKTLLLQMQDAFTSIAKTAEPFVVNITAQHPVTELEGLEVPPMRPQGPAPRRGPGTSPFPREAQATGSGVIVRSDGYILTNDHVVDGAPTVTVTLSDGREFRGRVYSDFRSDLAVVKIDPASTPLPAASFGDSDEVSPGQWAIAIGSPFDLQNTMTVGVVSATKRHQLIGDDPTSARYYPDLIQTDAAINPGNSGGPLLDIDGKVIGINVAIESPVEGSAGVGFAIPSRIAQQVMASLIQSGKVTRGYLGLAPSDLSPAQQTLTGVGHGAWVEQVDEDSPAGRAGIHAADVVTSFDGQPVDGELSMREAISNTAPGKSVAIALVRDGKPLTVTAMITAPPAGQPEDHAATQPTAAPKTVGVAVRTLTASDRSQLSLDPNVTGAIITSVDPNSPAADAGLQEKDVIEQVGTTKVATGADAIKALTDLSPDLPITLRVMRSTDGKLQEIALDVHIQ
ncbi:MAG TPA: trypsin-like peptidase domain-containing protein [Capsulimonadaceae bacterium]|nr:trypsin-like peptidase domain-containing protein [Capsulimonadaceae bacterium]